MATVRKIGEGYRRSIDLVRFVAAFGIVWDHARAPFADEGYLALALFLVMTSFFAVGSFERSDGTRFWWARVTRIAVPWLFWCAMYRVVYEVMSHSPGLEPVLTEPWSLLIGPFVHLWFLPFVMIALICIPYISRGIKDTRSMVFACLWLVVIALPLGMLHAGATPLNWTVNLGNVPQPFLQWSFSAPIFLFGALVAVARRLDLVWMPIAAAALISGFLFWWVPEFASVQMLLVALVFEVIWRIDIKGTWPAALAGYAFGIYLLHPFFMLVVFKFLGGGVDRSLGAILAFAGAWAGTWFLRQVPVLRRMV